MDDAPELEPQAGDNLLGEVEAPSSPVVPPAPRPIASNAPLRTPIQPNDVVKASSSRPAALPAAAAAPRPAAQMVPQQQQQQRPLVPGRAPLA